MKSRLIFLLTGAALFLAGCAAPRQYYVELNKKEALNSKAGKIGVAMAPLPKADTRFPGADCLLCIATASLVNSSLTSHTQKLPLEGLPEVKNTLAALIRKHGAEPVVIAEEIKIDALPDYPNRGTNIAIKDFTGLKQRYAVDKILMVEVPRVGMYRSFSGYIPVSDPRAEFEIQGYLVNLSNNTYEWYQLIAESKGTGGNWDEPPNFPGLTNAYFQVLETSKDRLINTFQ